MLKQSRSESIVEPEVPLNDLFVAVSADTSSPNGFVKGEGKKKRKKKDILTKVNKQMSQMGRTKM